MKWCKKVALVVLLVLLVELILFLAVMSSILSVVSGYWWLMLLSLEPILVYSTGSVIEVLCLESAR